MYNDVEYYYVKNIQGDIIGLVDSSGTWVVEYSYDAWGRVLLMTGTLASTLGQDNPLRYRGYFYDSETGLYYLKSRYYSPELGRFISSDSQLNIINGLSCFNLYAYCGNNPVNRSDMNGTFWEDVKSWVKGKVESAKSYVKKAVDSFVQKAVSKLFTSGSSNILKTLHYEARAIANGNHATYSQVISDDSWTKIGEDQTKFHDNRNGNSEQKFTHNDGREAVFDGDTLLPMTDSRYIATYNVCSIRQLPKNKNDHVITDYVLFGATTVLHGVYDVVPYYIWGNSSDDTTPLIDRIIMSN